MKDMIYREDAIEAVMNNACATVLYSSDNTGVLDILNTLPSAEAVKVAYICDGRRCDSDCSECFRTLDIEHARDFKLMGDTYFQQEAEANPTVIRSRTFMPTKDFKEWAKRIREVNPNAVVIPCDAEVPSAEDDWIPCSERLPEIDETLRPCDQISEEVLGTDTYGNIRHAYLTNCGYLKPTFCTVEEGMSVNILAWMPLPKPYKGGDDE